MSNQQDLLIEIGTEELPPKALATLSKAFLDNVEQQLQQLGLNHRASHKYATPRRLALLINELDIAQKDKLVERRGPALKAAYDETGKPTKAVEGFARSCGVSVDDLKQKETPKGVWLVHEFKEQGHATKELLPEVIDKALAELPIPKRMRWGSRQEEFVRPVHWVAVVLGSETIPGEIMGCTIGNQTRGHRFHHPDNITIRHPAEYEQLLNETGHVIADFTKRKETIRSLVEDIAAMGDASAMVDDDLLEEVTALTEWPVALMGDYDEEFLDVPSECLVQAMQGHQKYFPVVDEQGKLVPKFITISNIVSKDIEQVRSGNERVIRPRFSDAAFFWQQDLKNPLDSHIENLRNIKFQEKLGSLYDKSARVARLAESIASALDYDSTLASRAAWLCKCDLMTEMVGEFAKLQGIMGRYYAERSGEPSEVSVAMEEIYQPRYAGDEIPGSKTGKVLAIADRLDTLIGIFAVGLKPTGAKDPYGLRRAALGVLRIIIESPLELDLRQLLQSTAEGLAGQIASTTAIDEVFEYMMERLKAYYTDQSIPADSIDSVLVRNPTKPADFDQRVRAVSAFRKLPEAESLAAANKRIRNILKKSSESLPDLPDTSLFGETAEQALHQAIMDITPEVEPLFKKGDYTQGLLLLAKLRQPVDRFFDQVMVMTDDDEQRVNRLALLTQLENLFLHVADFSRLQ
jgi:glycyl-tRNA synthetase beta chain